MTGIKNATRELTTSEADSKQTWKETWIAINETATEVEEDREIVEPTLEEVKSENNNKTK